MPLSAEVVAAHISKWETALNTPWNHPYRQKWPSRLFHHTPLENAVKILKSHELQSRNDSENIRERDVAAAGVIDARDHAHDSARLYFRPKTPTQYHIEGIRKAGIVYKYEAHAPVLIMMIFDARRVLVQQGIKFCDRNMQLAAAQPNDTEEYFAQIPFEKVYHEGNTGGDKSITDHRCAEVLATSPLALKENLQFVYCRSHAERQTLLHLLGAAASEWSGKIVVSDDIVVFQKRYTFVEHVELATDGIIFQLNPPENNQPHKISVKLWDATNTQLVQTPSFNLNPKPENATRWKINMSLKTGSYLAQIDVEDHLAFRSHLTIGDQLV